MRNPRPSDVLDAVDDVMGPTYSRTERARATRLACHSLSEICELDQSAIGRVLGIDRTTARYHLKKPVDIDTVRVVIQLVSDRIDAEDLESLKARTERILMRESIA